MALMLYHGSGRGDATKLRMRRIAVNLTSWSSRSMRHESHEMLACMRGILRRRRADRSYCNWIAISDSPMVRKTGFKGLDGKRSITILSSYIMQRPGFECLMIVNAMACMAYGQMGVNANSCSSETYGCY
jgi:hypothetical protein